ncbi:hypothetical protein FACS1894166_01440 [Bacilli bacterium]|nr:hypothetical protein FACS1894166_01440 [Bacilli bacterium]
MLTHLIINLDKDYGARALANPVKVKESAEKFKKFTERQARYKAEKEAKMKAQAELEAMDTFKKEPTNE